MTHEYEGRYKTKHDSDAALNPALAEKVGSKATDGRLTCSLAFAVAEETGSSPAEIGRTADLLELKITQCQLGLFGYGKGRRNIVEPAESVSRALEQALSEAAGEGRVSCKKAWQIAEQFGLSKMDVTAACEKVGIRLGICQLGTF
jgi:hypothetical protein